MAKKKAVKRKAPAKRKDTKKKADKRKAPDKRKASKRNGKLGKRNAGLP